MDLKAGDQNAAEYRRINPKGRVPALQTDKGVLTESPVILGYLAQTFPDAHLANNDDSFAFGNMQAFNMWLASTVHPAFGHIFRPGRFSDDEGCATSLVSSAKTTLRNAFTEVEERLRDGGPFVHGAEYTISDPYLYVFVRWFFANTIGQPGDYPKVLAHRQRLEARPAVGRALAQEGLS